MEEHILQMQRLSQNMKNLNARLTTLHNSKSRRLASTDLPLDLSNSIGHASDVVKSVNQNMNNMEFMSLSEGPSKM